MISDVADGFIARKFNQKTVLGTFLDPMSDKVLLILNHIFYQFFHYSHLNIFL